MTKNKIKSFKIASPNHLSIISQFFDTFLSTLRLKNSLQKVFSMLLSWCYYVSNLVCIRKLLHNRIFSVLFYNLISKRKSFSNWWISRYPFPIDLNDVFTIIGGCFAKILTYARSTIYVEKQSSVKFIKFCPLMYSGVANTYKSIVFV